MDDCSMCGHQWHGLVCGHQTTTFDKTLFYSVTEKCKCPGPQFPAYDEGPRVTSKKGRW